MTSSIRKKSKTKETQARKKQTARIEYPFSAIVGQAELKQALICAAIDQTLGGVLIFGDRGTGKSTTIRSLAALLPKMDVATDCPYNCDPQRPAHLCERCLDDDAETKLKKKQVTVPVVDLPLGATEDRVVGALDLEHALSKGEKLFEPGLLARAHRGFLYIDEVNLLEDHLVDLLLDVAASGENVVEREGLSVRHPARFVLVGSGNPEEGELRPQLLDRYGLSVEVKTPTDVSQRIDVVKRRDAYEQDPAAFAEQWKNKNARLRTKIKQAQARLSDVNVPDETLVQASTLCMTLGTDGLRGELTLMRAARALAAYEGSQSVTLDHVKQMAACSLGHRLRRNPLDDASSRVRVDRAIEDLFSE